MPQNIRASPFFSNIQSLEHTASDRDVPPCSTRFELIPVLNPDFGSLVSERSGHHGTDAINIYDYEPERLPSKETNHQYLSEAAKSKERYGTRNSYLQSTAMSNDSKENSVPNATRG